MKNNQIGIVGVGYWGTNIINVLVKLKNIDIYCFDNNPNNLKEIKKKFKKINIIRKFDDFLKKDLKGVIIATNNKSHYYIAKKCLENGFNIFIEKPVTNSLKKINKLKILSKKKINLLWVDIYIITTII